MFANCSTHASIMIVILFLFRFIAKYEKRLIRIEDGSIEYQMIENHLVFASLYQSLQSERSTGNITCMLHEPSIEHKPQMFVESCICFVKKTVDFISVDCHIFMNTEIYLSYVGAIWGTF